MNHLIEPIVIHGSGHSSDPGLPGRSASTGRTARDDFETPQPFGAAAAWKAAVRRIQLRRIAKSSVQTLVVVCCLLPLATATLGQEVPADRLSVPFRDPSRPGMVKVNLMMGGINVKGYDGKEVVVEARLHGKKSTKKENADEKAEGLKRIEIATTGLTVEEEDNVVTE